MVRMQTLLLQMRTSKFLPNNFHLHLGWWHMVSESQPQKLQGCLYLMNHRHGFLFFALTSFWNPWLLEDVSAAGRCFSYWKMYLLLEDVSVPYRCICCWCSCSYPSTGLFIIFSVPLLLQTSSLALSGPGLSLLHKHDNFVLQRLPCLNIVTSSLRKDRTHLTANSFPSEFPWACLFCPWLSCIC